MPKELAELAELAEGFDAGGTPGERVTIGKTEFTAETQRTRRNQPERLAGKPETGQVR
jgi:hypothetical protein